MRPTLTSTTTKRGFRFIHSNCFYGSAGRRNAFGGVINLGSDFPGGWPAFLLGGGDERGGAGRDACLLEEDVVLLGVFVKCLVTVSMVSVVIYVCSGVTTGRGPGRHAHRSALLLLSTLNNSITVFIAVRLVHRGAGRMGFVLNVPLVVITRVTVTVTIVGLMWGPLGKILVYVSISASGFDLVCPSRTATTGRCDNRTHPSVSVFILRRLKLPRMFDLGGDRLSRCFAGSTTMVGRHRRVFRSVLTFPRVSTALGGLVPILASVLRLHQLRTSAKSARSCLRDVARVRLCVSNVSALGTKLSPVGSGLGDASLHALTFHVFRLTRDSCCGRLGVGLTRLAGHIHSVHDIAVKMGLSTRLHPTDTNILSVGPRPFHSNSILRGVLHLGFGSSRCAYVTDLIPFNGGRSRGRGATLTLTFGSTVGSICGRSLHS